MTLHPRLQRPTLESVAPRRFHSAGIAIAISVLSAGAAFAMPATFRFIAASGSQSRPPVVHAQAPAATPSPSDVPDEQVAPATEGENKQRGPGSKQSEATTLDPRVTTLDPAATPDPEMTPDPGMTPDAVESHQDVYDEDGEGGNDHGSSGDPAAPDDHGDHSGTKHEKKKHAPKEDKKHAPKEPKKHDHKDDPKHHGHGDEENEH